MELCFVFPSLQTLSVVSIGQYLASKKLGGFRFFPSSIVRDINSDLSSTTRAVPTVQECCEQDDDYPFGFDDIVNNLQIPNKFISQISVVLTGMHEQVWYWSRRCTQLHFSMYMEMDLLFNAHGVFEESLTWERYYERQLVHARNNQETLKRFLYVACEQKLLPLVSLLLNQILVAVAGQETGQLARPATRLWHLVYPLAVGYSYDVSLHYSFEGLLPDPSIAYKHFSFLNGTRWANSALCVSEDGMDLYFTLNSLANCSIHTFKKVMLFYRSVPVSMDITFCAKYELVKKSKLYDSGFVVSSLKHLDEDCQRYCLQKPETVYILKCFLTWPFVQFFLNMVGDLKKELEFSDYRILFVAIVDRITTRSGVSNLYGKLLMKFWFLIPSEEKKRFQAAFCLRREQDLFNAMQQLMRKDAFVHSVITQPD